MENPLTLVVLPSRYAVCRLAADAPFPSWALGEFVSISRSADELSVVCVEDALPADVRCERSWRCLRVAEKLDFEAVGILASLTAPLAEAGISVFVVSTFDTDYLMVREQSFALASEVLQACGHKLLPTRTKPHGEPRMELFTIQELLSERQRAGRAYLEFLRVPSMSLGIYSLPAGGADPQKPHGEDEVYYVLRGRATIRVGAEDRAVEPGSIVFVAANVEHRFHSITEDLTLLVFFAPAES